MISNQILQTTVDGLKEISRVDLCVIDAEGKVVAKTFDSVAECTADALVFIDSPADSQVVNGYQFFKVVEDGNLEYIILAKERRSCGAILGYQKKKESSNIVRAGTSFCSTVESMKQISENYLNNEKCYVNDWAAYISSVGMTREEVIEYISKTNTQPERQEAALCQSLKRT